MEVKIEEHTCATLGCGVTFWLSEAYVGRRRADKQGFYCPNGHSLAFSGETDTQKLFRERQEKARITLEKDIEIADLKKQLRKKCRKPRAKK